MSFIFWKHWSRSYRIVYIVALFVLVIGLLGFVIAWWRGLANVIRWDVLSELIDLPATIYAFTDGLQDFRLNGTVYAVSEQFVASAMQVYPWMAQVLLLVLCVSAALILSAMTQLSRWRYLIGMGLFLIALSLFRFEMLAVPGFEGAGTDSRLLFLLIAFVFGSVSYYFHAFRQDILLPIRLAVFAALLAVVVGGLGYLANAPLPALTIVSYGMPALLVLSVGFIFFISPEILAGLVWLTSARLTTSDEDEARPILGFKNLLFISLLYIINLLLTWLKNTKAVDWDLLAVSPFVIYLISVVLGIWGFRRLTEQQKTVSFGESGAFLYAGLALLCTATITYAFATANDPMIEAVEDVIVYSHLVMGILFLIYVAVNFLPLYQQGLAVHKVVYKPKRLELSLFRVVGVFGVFTLIGLQDFFPFRQAVTGYYNGLGDLYVASGEFASATAFYQQALEHEFQNHKANYSLASLALTNDDRTTAAYYYNQALLKQPSPQAYAGLSQAYLQNSLFFEAIKVLQRGIKAFPKSGELQNNLGFLYARTSVADSAYYYLQNAVANSQQSAVPKSNLLGLYARNPQVLAADSSLLKSVDDNAYESYQANALALRLIAGTDTTGARQPAWLSGEEANKGLSVGRFASLYNYALAVNAYATQPETNAPYRPKTWLTPESMAALDSLKKVIQRVSQQPVNQDFVDDLLLAQAMVEYKANQPAIAFSRLEQLGEGNARKGATYRTMRGLLMLEQQLYRPAAEVFGQNTDTLSAYYQAIALTKAGANAIAQSRWEIAAKNDATVSALKQVLYGERLPANDLERAFYVVYRPDDANRGKIWEQVKDPNLRTIAGVTLIDQYINTRQWFYAQMVLSQLAKPEQLSAYALSVENLAALRLAVARRNGKAAMSMAQKFMLPQHEAERLLYVAQAHLLTRQPARAAETFATAVRLAPLRAEIVTAAAQFKQQQRQTQGAYDLIVKALPFNEDKPELLKTYILLCLDLGLRDYAANRLAQLQSVAAPADYQAFLTTYQEKLTLIEKSRQNFVQ